MPTDPGDLAAASEEVAREIVRQISKCYCNPAAPHTCQDCTYTQHVLARLVLAAKEAGKVEAHLEDARAGCLRFCGGERWHPAEKLSGSWRHINRMDGHIVRFCERPEVHDALSRLRAQFPAEKGPSL